MTLPDLVARLEHELGMTVGRGPRHPVAPDPLLRRGTDEFLAANPGVRSDPGYVRFLEEYSGASVEEDPRILDIFGLSAAATSIVDMEGPVVDDDGFLIFAQCMYYDVSEGKLLDSYEYDFALSMTDTRPRGIYSCVSTMDSLNESYTYHVDNFTLWLQDLLDREGTYERPALP